MKLLLDTCTFLWIAGDDRALSRNARELFRDPGNEVFLSVASVWEIVIKNGRRALRLPEPVDRFVQRARSGHMVESLGLDEAAVLQLGRLPILHRDPFDRILVCQAISEGMAILTPDELIHQYPVRTLW